MAESFPQPKQSEPVGVRYDEKMRRSVYRQFNCFDVSGAVVALLFTLLLCGCERSESSVSQADSNVPRIVSLSPAISRTLIDFDLDEILVGRSRYCESVKQSIPVVGDLTTVDYEQLLQLNPTHVLVQPPRSGVDPKLIELAAANDWILRDWILDGRDDIETLIRDIPLIVFPDDIPRREASAKRAADLLNDIALVLRPAENGYTGTVFLVSGIDPLFVAGRETYLHDILVSLGAKNAVDTTGWPVLSLEDATQLNPGAIVLLADDESELDSLRTLSIDAVMHDRIAVLSNPDAMTPSSGIIGVANDLHAILRRFNENEQ